MTPQATDRGTAWLSDAGLRPTRQRVALAALLVGDGQHRHVTAESLFSASHWPRSIIPCVRFAMRVCCKR